jgi:hypothetical protein
MCHRKALLQQRRDLLLIQPLRQRVSDERSNGAACWNTTSPQKY